MDWIQIGVVATVLLTVSTVVLNTIGILDKIFSFIRGAWKKITRLVGRTASTLDVPTTTLVVIQRPQLNALWWSKGMAGEQPIMQIVGDFNLTNAWTKDIRLSGAILRYRRWIFFHKEVRDDASVQDAKSQYSGNYAVPPNAMTWLRVHFLFDPKSRFPSGNFTADVAVIDQFNNHHWLANLQFKNIAAMSLWA